SDLLPAGVTFVSAAPSQGSYDPGTGLWDVGTLPAGAAATLVIQARVVSIVPETNTATVIPGGQIDPDLSNNTGSAGFTPTPRASAASPRRPPPRPRLPPVPPLPPSKRLTLSSMPTVDPSALEPRFGVRTGGPAPAYLAVGSGPGYPAVVRVFDYTSGVERFRFFPYGPAFTGGVNVATRDVTGDGVPDIITGVRSDAGPHVKVFDGATGAEIASFFAYAPGFHGGVWVAAGDVDGDGRADIITGAGPGAFPHVEVFSGANLSLLRSFLAYAPSFTGGGAGGGRGHQRRRPRRHRDGPEPGALPRPGLRRPDGGGPGQLPGV